MLVHLDDAKHWNYAGKIKCDKCGTEADVKIEDGKVLYVRIAGKTARESMER